MKPGSQAALLNHLKTEYNIEVSRNAISLLVKAKDYRIIKTPKGKINVEQSAKALKDSGFGEQSKRIKARKNGKASPGKAQTNSSEKLNSSNTEEDLSDYITGKKQVTLASPTSVIHRYKEFQQAEKERIKNEKASEKLIDVDEVGEKSFNLWRHFRDELQTMKDRLIIKIRAADSEHEAEQIYRKESDRILNSVVPNFKDLSNSDIKKKLVLRLMSTIKAH